VIAPSWAEAAVEQMKRATVEATSKPKMAKRTRRAKFAVDWNFDGSRAATLVINMGAGTIAVRPFRRRRSYELPLADVALMIAQRVARADAKSKIKARGARR
jgi:hypothetical protein